MNLFDFFRKKSVTQAELSAQWEKIQGRKKELDQQAAELRRVALKEEVKDLSAQLSGIRDEVEMLATAEVEIEVMLRKLLVDDIEAKYNQLPQERTKYDNRCEEVSRQAAKYLTQAFAMLRALGPGWGLNLVNTISEAIEKSSRGNEYSHLNMDAFLAGLNQACGLQVEDFEAWRKTLASIEKKSPGSPEAGKAIDGLIKMLLYKPALAVVPGPAPPRVPFRFTIDTPQRTGKSE